MDRECSRNRKDRSRCGRDGALHEALVDPLFSAPELDPIERERLAHELEKLPLGELRRWCMQLDPGRAHLGKTQLLRAIETALLSGARISDLHAAHKAKGGRTSSDRACYLVIDPGPALSVRIESRVDSMIAGGWADEVRGLIDRVPRYAPAWKASGYRAMRDHVEGLLDLSSARERIIIETRQYAKRQRTWFRHQLPSAAVTHLNPDDPRAFDVAREWWERAE